VIELPESLGETVTEVDFYDNLIRHLRGLDHFTKLTSLDLSFNKLKHIKNIDHLVQLRDLFFVQNRIQKIEGLETLTKLRNLELGANRIRVCAIRRTLSLRLTLLDHRECRAPDVVGRALVREEQDHTTRG
jgi:Leucine-rich repeat (LRR) protein